MDDVLRRVPPQNIEAEQSVLGAVLLDNDALNVALEVLVADDFYRETHREIFRAMVALAEKSEPVDAITLTNALRGMGTLEQCGGPAYVGELADAVPTAANIQHYANIVREKALLRRVGQVAGDICNSSFEENGDANEFLDRAEHQLFELGDRRARSDLHDAASLTRDSLKILENLYEKREIVTGCPTGFYDLDVLTAGLQPSDLVVVAARPSMGKTALALNVVAHAAIDAQPRRGVVVFSFEMSKEQLMLRLLCSDARVDTAKARAGFLSERDFPKLAQAAARIGEAPLWISDKSDLTVLAMKATCRRMAKQLASSPAPLGLIVADYLQLIRPMNPKDMREQQVAQISRELKALAKELAVPVLLLAQLNRQVEARTERRPVLADIRESGAIEQDADVIAFIYREEMYKRPGPERDKVDGQAELIVAKQRNGPTDTVRLSYLKQYTRFENYADSQRYD